MYWYLVHNIMYFGLDTENNKNSTKGIKENKNRDLQTFILGFLLHFFTYLLLAYYGVTHPFLQMLHDFYYYIIIGDMITMAVVYRNYWNKSIVNEVSEVLELKPSPEPEDIHLQ